MTEEEIEACRLAFEKFDADGSGTIEANELKVTLQSMGQNPTDEEIFEMLSSVDEDGSGRCARGAPFSQCNAVGFRRGTGGGRAARGPLRGGCAGGGAAGSRGTPFASGTLCLFKGSGRAAIPARCGGML